MVELPNPRRSGGLIVREVIITGCHTCQRCSQDSLCAQTPVESGGRGSLPSETIDIDRYGHRLVVDWPSVDDRALARRGGCAGANGAFAPCTPLLGGRSARGSPREEPYPDLAHTSVQLGLEVLSKVGRLTPILGAVWRRRSTP
eukprot:6200646-Pleurochrysis_carterae.AAC.1